MIAVVFAGVFGLAVGRLLSLTVDRLPALLISRWRADAVAMLGQQLSDTADPQQLPGRMSWDRRRYSLFGVKLPAVELVSAVVAATVISQVGFTWPGLSLVVVGWGLLVLAFIDAHHQLLPDAIVLPLLWLGLIANHFGLFVDLDDALMGTIAGYISFWSIYWIFKLATGKEGMGYGDFKLLAMLGAWGGWQILWMVILLSSVAAAVYGLTAMRLNRMPEGAPMPFGPFLAVAGFVALLWGALLESAFLRLITHY